MLECFFQFITMKECFSKIWNTHNKRNTDRELQTDKASRIVDNRSRMQILLDRVRNFYTDTLKLEHFKEHMNQKKRINLKPLDNLNVLKRRELVEVKNLQRGLENRLTIDHISRSVVILILQYLII